MEEKININKNEPRPENKSNLILSEDYVKLVVYDEKNKKELVVITSELVQTTTDITIKLTPSN